MLPNFIVKPYEYLRDAIKTNGDPFVAGIILDLILPATPSYFEYRANDRILSVASVYLFAAFYVLVVGLQSKMESVKLVGLLACLFLSSEYGYAVQAKVNYPSAAQFIGSTESYIILIFLIYGLCSKIKNVLIANI